MADDKKPKKKKSPTAQKRQLQDEKKRMRNRMFKSSVRTATRKFETALKSGDKEELQKRLDTVYSAIDGATKRGIYKVNKASRTKARLYARFAAAS